MAAAEFERELIQSARCWGRNAIQMASSGPTVGVLVSATRWEGRAAYFEGAYFMLLKNGELTTPVRISAPGPQFIELVPYRDGEYLAGGDQEPLTQIRLRSDGTIVWRRQISSKLVLPQLAVGPNGDIYVVSQAGPSVVRVSRRKCVSERTRFHKSLGNAKEGRRNGTSPLQPGIALQSNDLAIAQLREGS